MCFEKTRFGKTVKSLYLLDCFLTAWCRLNKFGKIPIGDILFYWEYHNRTHKRVVPLLILHCFPWLKNLPDDDNLKMWYDSGYIRISHSISQSFPNSLMDNVLNQFLIFQSHSFEVLEKKNLHLNLHTDSPFSSIFKFSPLCYFSDIFLYFYYETIILISFLNYEPLKQMLVNFDQCSFISFDSFLSHGMCFYLHL